MLDNTSQMFDDKIDEAVSSTDLFGADQDEKIRVLQARKAHDELELMKGHHRKNHTSVAALHVLQDEFCSSQNSRPVKKQYAMEEIHAHAAAVANSALKFRRKKRRKRSAPLPGPLQGCFLRFFYSFFFQPNESLL